MNVTTLILVKHALPVIDASKPAKEWQLSAEGELQTEVLAERLRTFAPLRMIASPEPKAKPKSAPSRLATFRSRASRVGFWVRPYSYPLFSPSPSCR